MSGKADFFIASLCVMFSFSGSLGEPLGRGDPLTSDGREAGQLRRAGGTAPLGAAAGFVRC